MRLGNRLANVRHAVAHDTVGLRTHAVNAELWHEFHAGQRVQTVDGIAGVVAAVEDGPFPGAEQYVVELDRGLGGGQYTAAQLTALGPAQASEVHTAADDYPEMGSILHDRPDIAKKATQHIAAEKCDVCDHPRDKEDRHLGFQGCTSCGTTVPFRVTVKDGLINLDGKPFDHGWGPQAHSGVFESANGSGYSARFDNVMPGQRSYRAKGSTPLGAARNATKAWAADVGKEWHIVPAETRKKIDKDRREAGY
jgi:hypothetical protein